MNEQYTASVFCEGVQIAKQFGDDVDKLYAWMLAQVTDRCGDIHGEIVDNQTQKIIRTFCKSAIE